MDGESKGLLNRMEMTQRCFPADGLRAAGSSGCSSVSKLSSQSQGNRDNPAHGARGQLSQQLQVSTLNVCKNVVTLNCSLQDVLSLAEAWGGNRITSKRPHSSRVQRNHGSGMLRKATVAAQKSHKLIASIWHPVGCTQQHWGCSTQALEPPLQANMSWEHITEPDKGFLGLRFSV